MRLSRGRAKPFRTRWADAAIALLVLGGCAPPFASPTAGPPAEPSVRVGVLVDTQSVTISSPTGFSLADPVSGRVVREIPAATPASLISDPSAGLLRVQVGGTPFGTDATWLLARPTGSGPIEIGGRPYRGTALVQVARPGRVTAINQVDMEAYLLGVVPQEIGTVGDTLVEAAKAQAVAARTYAVKYLGRRSELGFDVFATVQDQVYGGIRAEHEPVSRAVRATAGEILTFAGEPIEAYYHSTCAGRTAAIDEVWNQAPTPYLVSVVDVNPATGQAYDMRSSRFRWTTRWTAAQLNEILSRTLADSLRAGATAVGEIRDLRVVERTPSDRIRALRVSTTNGEFTVGGDRIRWIFLTPEGRVLNSSKFDVELVRDAQGRLTEIIATGGGWGHGIGMCQVGAMGRAKAGQEYRDILRAYYPGTELRDLY